MNNTRPSFISQRVRVNPPLSADTVRYQYLNLENAEPNFGVPSLTASSAYNTFVLTTNSIGQRFIVRTTFWDSTYTTLQQNSGNWLTIQTADSRYLRLTGGTIEGDLLVRGGVFATGGLSAVSAQYFITTLTSITSLSVQSLGYEPALFVGAGGGNFYIATFKDVDNNVEVLRINDATGGRGKIGINNPTPNTELTVNGTISTNNPIYTGIYNSDQFGSTYVSTRTTSANWDTVYSTVRSLSDSWEESAEILPTVTNYLSTNNVLIKNLTVTTGLSVKGGLSADAIYGVYQNNIIDAFVGDGITLTFNLTQTVASVNNILVYVGGIYQDKATYSIASGPSRIIFTQAPPAPDVALDPNIEVVYLQSNPMTIGTVADASITTQKIADRAVTSSKLDSNLTVYGSLSVVGTLSAANYILTNSFIPYQAFDVTTGQTTFSLLCAAASVNEIQVFVSGVYQNKSTYSLSDVYTLVLSQAPPAGTAIVEVAYIRPFPGTAMYPFVNSVLASSITTGAVTTSKIASNAITGDKLATDFTLSSNLTALSSFTVTKSMSVLNTSTNMALYVGSSTANSLAKIGVNTTRPSSELTVRGTISASGDIQSPALTERIFTTSLIFS
jgi:hypothetical protein